MIVDSRDTIHPHPKGCGLLCPLTPRDKKRSRSYRHIILDLRGPLDYDHLVFFGSA